ncbi:MAG TPA: helix-turn-helix domain-containing protein [Sporichthyaceae bacterium]|jgi:transcriptional regulator GlxA family with amidase domain
MPALVVVVALENVVPFNLGVPGQVFGAPTAELAARYELAVCSPGHKVRTCEGLIVHTEHGLEILTSADVIILAGTAPVAVDIRPDVRDALRAAYSRGARLVSLCTGAFVLAAAGLLDGRRATTHWLYSDELAARYPAIDVQPEVLFIDDGQVLTSAGLAAGIDLCLHIVRSDHGAEVANRCARYVVSAPHRPGGQAQYIEAPVPALSIDPLAATQAWMLDHLDQDLSLDRMATHAGMSRRSFTRRFRNETSTTPVQWLLDQRILHARRLLECTDRSVDQVAEDCGMHNGTALRRHFRSATGTTPSAYREAFTHRSQVRTDS